MNLKIFIWYHRHQSSGQQFSCCSFSYQNSNQLNNGLKILGQNSLPNKVGVNCNFSTYFQESQSAQFTKIELVTNLCGSFRPIAVSKVNGSFNGQQWLQRLLQPLTDRKMYPIVADLSAVCNFSLGFTTFCVSVCMRCVLNSYKMSWDLDQTYVRISIFLYQIITF